MRNMRYATNRGIRAEIRKIRDVIEDKKDEEEFHYTQSVVGSDNKISTVTYKFNKYGLPEIVDCREDDKRVHVTKVSKNSNRIRTINVPKVESNDGYISEIYVNDQDEVEGIKIDYAKKD